MENVNKSNIIDLLNPKFYIPYLNNKTYNILKGGRSSTKSSFVSIRLVMDFLKDPNANIICLRKVGKYLKDSVYEQISWAIITLGVENQFEFRLSPLRMIHKETNTKFYFLGVDDPKKLKSTKISKGYVSRLWFEELDEFKGVDEIDSVEDTFIREDLESGEVKVYYTYNPPRNPYSWVNKWTEERKNDKDYLVHHSSYLDDKKGFLSKQLIKKINKYKENDLDYYRWMYLGEAIGLGDNVYNMELFKSLNEFPEDDSIKYIYYAADTGHQVSATTNLCIALTMKDRVILLDTYYYSPAGRVKKKAPSELSADLYNHIKKTSEQNIIRNRVIDSAEGGLRNQYYLDYRQRWNPVKKLKNVDMIDRVQDLLAQGRFYYINNENNKIFIEEHRQYQWNADTLESDNPQVIKENDHTCDAFKYFCVANARDIGLKW